MYVGMDTLALEQESLAGALDVTLSCCNSGKLGEWVRTTAPTFPEVTGLPGSCALIGRRTSYSAMYQASFVGSRRMYVF